MIKTKTNKWDLVKLKKAFHSKGNYRQNLKKKKKTAFRMKESICKRQGINLQNTQTAYAVCTKKAANQKMGGRSEQTVL